MAPGFRAGAATGDDVGVADQAADPGGADDARGGAGEQRLDRPLGGAGDRHDAAVGLGEARLDGHAHLLQRSLQGAEVLRDARLHIAADDRRDGALVLADDGPGGARQEHGQAGGDAFAGPSIALGGRGQQSGDGGDGAAGAVVAERGTSATNGGGGGGGAGRIAIASPSIGGGLTASPGFTAVP